MAKSRREQLEKFTIDCGLWVCSYSPGDGVTRYRFFDKAGNDYFGPDNGIYTALGIADARTFLTGYFQGKRKEIG